MDVQRLRNLTTGVVHTEEEHIPQDIEYLTGVPGILGEMIPAAIKALKPWLSDLIDDDSMWGAWVDVSNQGELEIHPMNYAEKKAFFKRFNRLYDDYCVKEGKTAPIKPDNCFVAPMDSLNLKSFNFIDLSSNPCVSQNQHAVVDANGTITITSLEETIDVNDGCAQLNLKDDEGGVVTVKLKNGKNLKFPKDSSSISYETVPITKHGFGEPLFTSGSLLGKERQADESDKKYRERLISQIAMKLSDSAKYA